MSSESDKPHEESTRTSDGDPLNLEDAIADYMARVDSGEPVDPDEFLAEYPQFADELREFLANDGLVDEVIDDGAAPSDELHEIKYLGTYEIIETIGKGGMGVVYKARQTTLGRIVAVKVIRSGDFASPSEVQRFKTEAEAVAKLDHPNIVPVIENGVHEGHHYFSMAYVDGASLSTKLAGGPLPAREAAEICRTVSDAIHFAHQHAVIHRDIKPGNILIASDGTVRITDFGLAKRIDANQDDLTRNEILGTPGYMSPEQASASSNITVATDVYSVGAMLYALTTGRPPFLADNLLDTLDQVRNREPIAPRRLNDKIPVDFESITLKCLEKDPRKRYASADELKQDLDRFLSNKPTLARPLGPMARLLRWGKRNRVVASSIGVVAVALIAATIISSLFAVYATDQAEKATEAKGELQVQLVENHRMSISGALKGGDWEAVLESIEQSLENDPDDPVWLQLQRVKVLNALGRTKDVRDRMRELSEVEDKGKWEAEIMLWTGDVGINRPLGKDDPLELVARARELKLSPVDDAYAGALLAKSTREALALLQKVLDEAPYDHRALSMSAVLNVFIGRHERAGTRIALGQLLYPDDLAFATLPLMVVGLSGDSKEFNKVVEGLRDRLPEGVLKQWKDFFESLRRLRVSLFEVEETGAKANFMKLLKVGQLMLRVTGVSNPNNLEAINIRAPQCLKNGYKLLPAFLKASRGGSHQFALETAAQLEKAAEDHPDGLLLFLSGLTYASRGEMATAEKVLLRAVDTPSVFPETRREALYWAARSADMLRRRHNDEEGGKRSTAHIRRLLKLGLPKQKRTKMLANVALEAGDAELTFRVADEWRRAMPEDTARVLMAGRAATFAGRHAFALRMADSVLTKDAKNGEAIKLRKKAIGKLEQTLKHARKGAETP